MLDAHFLEDAKGGPVLRFRQPADMFANLVGLYSAPCFNLHGFYVEQHKDAREHLLDPDKPNPQWAFTARPVVQQVMVGDCANQLLFAACEEVNRRNQLPSPAYLVIPARTLPVTLARDHTQPSRDRVLTSTVQISTLIHIYLDADRAHRRRTEGFTTLPLDLAAPRPLAMPVPLVPAGTHMVSRLGSPSYCQALTAARSGLTAVTLRRRPFAQPGPARLACAQRAPRPHLAALHGAVLRHDGGRVGAREGVDVAG